MTMELEFEQTLAPHFGTQQKVSPRLVAANHILELSSQQLQQAIATELSENPAVELVDEPLCHVCGTALHGSICPRCIQRQKGHESPTDRYSSSPDDVTARGSDEDDFDPMTRVASEQTLAEKLVSDMAAVLPERDLPIAEYLVGSLDDQGYLSVKVDDVAYELAVDAAHVQAVLRVLQAQDPIGIGARTLRECLLIQIDHLDERGVRQPHAREIVSQFLTELGEHKFSKIAHELRISTSAVASAWDFVKQELNPHPAHGFSGTNPTDRDTRAMYIIPDVTISRDVDGYAIDIVESRRFALRMNPMYTRLSIDLLGRHPSMSAEEKKHIQQYAGRARLFIANVNQRRDTMLKITTCIVEQQRAFLENGIRSLRPVSRADIAERIGVHESTVSRATASKYAMLPNGEVIPYAHFFRPNLSVKDVLKEIVEKEGRPLTDTDIRERLAARGIHIARRTVAKYRSELAILPSALR